MIGHISAIAVAFALDLLLGDPPVYPHPVRLIGSLISRAEVALVRLLGRTRTTGLLLILVSVGVPTLMVYLIVHIAGLLHPYARWCAETLFIYTALAARDLDVESRRVYHALKHNDMGRAREEVSKIVGRDTQSLDQTGIVVATTETIAENTVDGVVSPLFYAFIGGATGAYFYKAVNTLDSIVGHVNDRYRELGYPAAKLDDVLNWLPARLTGTLIALSSWVCGASTFRSLKAVWRDGRPSPAPNAGIPEAAMAGALGIQVGGPALYEGRLIPRPFLGSPARPPEPDDICRATRIMYATSVSALAVLSLVWGIMA